MKYTLIILTLCISFGSWAQTDPNLPNSEIEIIKSFNARLAEAKMLDVPTPEHEVDTNRAFIRQYKLSTQPITLSYPAPKMKPLAMPLGENPVNHPLYARLGYGLPSNPFGQITYYYGADRFNIQAQALYESLDDNENDLKSFRNFEGVLDANIYLTDMLLIKAKGSYTDQERFYYATQPFFEEDRRIDFKIPEVGIGFRNALETASNIDYQFNYRYRSTSSLDTKENNHLITGGVNKTFNEGSFSLGLHTDIELNSYNRTIDIKTNNYLFGLSAGLRQSKWNAKSGIDVVILDDETAFLPQLRVNTHVSSLVRPFIGVHSYVNQNNFHNLTRDNPYINHRLDTINTNRNMEFFIGTAGENDQFSYEFKVGYALGQDQALFINDFPDTNRFRLIYDDVNTLTIGLNTTVKPAIGWTAGAGVQFNSYNSDRTAEAWHLPGFQWHLNGAYDKLLRNQLNLKAQIRGLSGIKFLDGNNESETLKALINFDIHIDYELSKSFNAFIHLNNILDNEKDRYLGYDQVGINPQIGVSVRF